MKTGFQNWPAHQKVILPILIVLAFGAAVSSSPMFGGDVELQSADPRIIDGDTVELDGRKVRIIGIDAPDTGPANDILESASQLYLEELAARYGGIQCQSGFLDRPLAAEKVCQEPSTSFGRANLSCRFRSNGASVAATMVRHGYAVDFRRYSGLAFARFMQQASQERRGLWSIDYGAMRELAVRRGELPQNCL